jgi:hypothetical protein
MTRQELKQALFMAALAMLSLAGASCSNFERDWRAAVDHRPSRSTGIEGPWEGTWTSEPTGHHGKLRCIVGGESSTARRAIARDRTFQYHATWGKLLSGTFTTVQPVIEKSPAHFQSEGDWALPRWAGGKYHYRIEGTPSEMRATYRSGVDHGTFHLVRPAVAGAVAR